MQIKSSFLFLALVAFISEFYALPTDPSLPAAQPQLPEEYTRYPTCGEYCAPCAINTGIGAANCAIGVGNCVQCCVVVGACLPCFICNDVDYDLDKPKIEYLEMPKKQVIRRG